LTGTRGYTRNRIVNSDRGRVGAVTGSDDAIADGEDGGLCPGFRQGAGYAGTAYTGYGGRTWRGDRRRCRSCRGRRRRRVGLRISQHLRPWYPGYYAYGGYTGSYGVGYTSAPLYNDASGYVTSPLLSRLPLQPVTMMRMLDCLRGANARATSPARFLADGMPLTNTG
jgi:hypothetical protein